MEEELDGMEHAAQEPSLTQLRRNRRRALLRLRHIMDNTTMIVVRNRLVCLYICTGRTFTFSFISTSHYKCAARPLMKNCGGDLIA